jgi:uroporphyrinogen-III synthase
MVPVTEGRGGRADARSLLESLSLSESLSLLESLSLSQSLSLAGATPVEVEFIAIKPAIDAAALERAVRDWCDGSYAWMAVTSRNAVLAMDLVAGTLHASLADPIPPSRVAAVGDATRVVCESRGLPVALVPTIATGRGLAADFPFGDGRVLLPVGDKASAVLAEGLGDKGWAVTSVEAYRTVAGKGPTPDQVDSLEAGDVDAVMLTSGSMATQLASTCPAIHPSTIMIAIGPTTAAAASAAGLKVAAVADRPTYDALIEALSRSTGRITP